MVQLSGNNYVITKENNNLCQKHKKNSDILCFRHKIIHLISGFVVASESPLILCTFGYCIVTSSCSFERISISPEMCDSYRNTVARNKWCDISIESPEKHKIISNKGLHCKSVDSCTGC